MPNRFANSRSFASGGIATLMSGFGPKPTLAPPNEDGSATAEEIAAAAASAAAQKAAEEKAAADKAAADKVAADKAEAERKEAEAKMTDDEREKQKLLREVMEKKGKLKDTEDALGKATAELEKYKGLDLDKVRALLEAETKREEEDLERKGEYDRLKARIAAEREEERKTHAADKAALEKRIKELSGTIDNLTVGQSFNVSSFISEDLVLTPTKARALYGSHFEMVDGKTVAYDKPAGSANRTMYVGADGEPLPFDAALRKIVDLDPEKDTLLKAKITPGAGSKTLSGSKSQQDNKSKEGSLYGASRILAGLNAGQK